MSTRMVILGLLRDRPLYGYEIKHVIEAHMGDWTDIAFGSIYYALGKLEQDDAIEQVATEQEGNRPSRTVYRITEAGRAEFLDLLRASWHKVEHMTYAQDLALSFAEALPREELLALVRARAERLSRVLEQLDAHQAEQTRQPEVPPVAAAIFAHGRVHLEAELRWTEQVVSALERGDYDG